jgi:inorganic triphosphatase YgiF
MNTTLQQIHALLIAQHTALSQLLDETEDPDTARTILTEMQEVLHRINLVQNLLFEKASDELDALLPGIQRANTALTTSLGDIANIAGFLSAASSFLQGVDEAIDLAKTLAA